MVYGVKLNYSYPMASPEEVRKNEDNCAICWEPMKEARKLPCAHLFHKYVLYTRKLIISVLLKFLYTKIIRLLYLKPFTESSVVTL